MMCFTYIFRDKSGAKCEATIEAASREAAFAALKSRGILPLSIRTGGHLRSSSDSRVREHRRVTASQRVMVLALLVISAVLVGVWFWSRTNVNDEDDEVLSHVRNMSGHLPDTKTKRRAASTFVPKTKPFKTAKIAAPEIAKADVLFEPLKNLSKESNAIKLDFENAADEMIAGVMTARPGERFLHIPDDDDFDQEFEASMKNMLKVDKDDSPELLTKKQAVVDAKTAILEYMKNGERPSTIVREAIEHMNAIADYREKLENDLVEFSQNATRKDVTDYLAEANKILAEYGVDPITFDVNEMPPDDSMQSESPGEAFSQETNQQTTKANHEEQ